jgi:MAE_28990/MAE_18760-like HEPN
MRAFIHLFHKRKQEVNLYFEHLEDLSDKNAQLIFSDGALKTVDSDLKHILLANTFLLIYNLVESTFSAAIEAIFIEIQAQAVAYDAIQPSIQKEVIDNIRKNVAADSFISSVNDIAIDILNHYPRPRELFSGNVDAVAIKDISRKYGFSIRTEAEKTKNGEKLATVKKRRNHLAHGFMSFKECGQERPFEMVRAIKEESLLYIEQILNNIEQFLEDKKYLKS